MGRFLLLLLPLAAACIPSFENVECYSELDCVGGVCQDGVCVVPRPDTGTDAGRPDTGDAGFIDTGVDAGPVDTGPDAGPVDTGPDAGPDGGPDAGPDTGPPDAGFAVQVSPLAIDFGERPVACVGPDETAAITNLGVTPVNISSVTFAGGGSMDYALAPIVTPFMLMPAQSQTLTISWLPQNVGAHPGRVLVQYEPEPIPLEVQLTGTAVAGTVVTDMRSQTAGPIDILWVIDDNNGMDVLQTELANQILFMMTALDFEGWDYQIGVTTADLNGAAGALVGTPAFITPTNVLDPQAELESRVMLGTLGFPGDEGLEASRLALSAPLTSGANAGFLRASAALLVVYVAGDNESSPMNVSQYVAFLEGLKANGARVQANGILPTQTACSLPGATYFFAGRQIGMVNGTGGFVVDACGTQWLDALTEFPQAAPLQTTFTLGLTPDDPGMISVSVDGTVSMDWTYDMGQNAIIFGTAPPLGADIEITYPAGC